MSLITFATEDGLALEGELRAPDGEPLGTAVVCHPDPKRGGSKDHPLLWAIRDEIAGRRGLVVLAFNFRGVMGSEGEHAGGLEEPKDLRAAIDRVRREAPGPTVVAGWSFGANVALRHAATDPRVAALALVGLPVGEVSATTPSLQDDETLAGLTIPVLLVAGDADPICPVADLESLAARIPNARVRVLEGADHFLRGREGEASEAIGDLFADVAQS